MNIFKLVFIIINALLLLGCSKRSPLVVDENDKDYVRVDYSLVLADFNESQVSDTSFCGMTDFGIESSFDVTSIIRGNIDNLGKKFNVYSCEHWSDQPFLERQISGLTEDFNFKWLLLFAKKDYGYSLVEKEPVFYLKDQTQVFCSSDGLIKEMLKIKNKYLGEYVGTPVETGDGYTRELFEKSPCHSVKNGYAY